MPTLFHTAETTPERQRYLRYDGATGAKEIDLEPIFQNRAMTKTTRGQTFTVN